MDAVTMANLAAYSAQVLCLAFGAGLLLTLLRLNTPGLRYASLRATLVMCLLLPVQPRHVPSPALGESVTTTMTSAAESVASVAAAPVITADWPSWLTGVLLAGAAARLVWLAVGMRRLRRLRHAGEIADRDDHACLQEAIGTQADVRYIDGFAQPVTFGVRRPVVLLPASLRAQSLEIRQAVVAHELVHVRRGDWAWVIAEELARAVFWFHPAMWWLISRIQLAREEVVDALAVAYTGRRRAYVEALMTFADGVPLAPAPAFARKRHLFRRLMLISREDVMTAKRIVFSSMAMLAIMAVGAWYAVGAFPLVEVSAGQILQKQPGPLELAANPITPENPVPRRLHHEPAQYPPEAAAENVWMSVTLRMTIDSGGAVAEARVVGMQMRTSDGVTVSGGQMANFDALFDRVRVRARPGEPTQSVTHLKPIFDAVVNAAVAVVTRWRYDAPANAPVSIDTTFYFAPGLPVSDTPAAAASGVARLDGALRVGGNIKQPRKIKDVRPVYPLDAKDARVQGVVIVEARIDENGRVSDARVLRSIPLLDQAALDAVRRWEFETTLLNGVPTPIIMTVTVQFMLD